MSDFWIEGIYIVDPLDKKWNKIKDRTLPWTCLKSWYFGLSESHYLDLWDQKDNFEQAVRKEDQKTINKILKTTRNEKKRLNFSKLCEVWWYGSNIKVTAIVGENGSGKSQLMKEIVNIWNNNINHNNRFAFFDANKNYIPKDVSPEWYRGYTFFEHWIVFHKIIEKKQLFSFLLNKNNDSLDNNLIIFEIFKKWWHISHEFKVILNTFLWIEINSDSLLQLDINLKKPISDAKNNSENYIKDRSPYKGGMISYSHWDLYLYFFIVCLYTKLNQESEYSVEWTNEELTYSDEAFYFNGLENIIYLVNCLVKYFNENDFDLAAISKNLENNFYYSTNQLLQFCSNKHKLASDEDEIYMKWLKKYIIDMIKFSTWKFKGEVQPDIDNFAWALLEELEDKLKYKKRTEITIRIPNLIEFSKLSIVTTLESIGIASIWSVFELSQLENFIFDWKKITWFSSWEQSILLRFLWIISKVISSKAKDFYICIDEPDVFLHIRWQKKYIKKLIEYFSKITNKRFHFILATHSPFIVSDIPENNLLILEKWEDLTKKYVKTDEKNSFANTTFDIVSDYMGATTGQWETIGDFTKKIIDEYIKEMKKLLILKRNEESGENIAKQLTALSNYKEKFESEEDPKRKEMKQINHYIRQLQNKYQIIIEWIWDPILRQYLLLLRG